MSDKEPVSGAEALDEPNFKQNKRPSYAKAYPGIWRYPRRKGTGIWGSGSGVRA